MWFLAILMMGLYVIIFAQILQADKNKQQMNIQKKLKRTKLIKHVINAKEE